MQETKPKRSVSLKKLLGIYFALVWLVVAVVWIWKNSWFLHYLMAAFYLFLLIVIAKKG